MHTAPAELLFHQHLFIKIVSRLFPGH